MTRDGLRDSVTERLHLLNEFGGGDRDGATATDLLKLRRVESGVVVVGSALPQVRKQRLPGPFLTAVLGPPIIGRLAAGNPAEVVEGRAATEDAAAGALLVDALPDATVDELGLVSQSCSP
jgi:hypothetical protein